MNLYIDMGGTYLRYQIESGEIKTVARGNILNFLENMFKKYPQIERVSIAFAGQVQENIILSAPNIDIENLDLKAHFPNIEFRIENDLNSAVLAEANYWKSSDIIALYIGTGIGAGVISGGNLIRGVSNLAGEIGHIPFWNAPFLCGCGKNNCLELFCSGGAILKWADYLNKDFKRLEESPKDVYELFLDALLRASSILITLFNPKILVLGGGVVENNPFLLKYIEENISSYALNSSLNGLKIYQSRLKYAPLNGCKLL